MHIQARVPDKKKHSHWCWQWAKSNFGHFAGIMTISGHVKKDIGCLGTTKCLLSSHTNFLLVSNKEALLEGCYLYYDTNDNEWIRSGKVTNRSFATRHMEHSRSSKLTKSADLASMFYSSYPSTSACIATTYNYRKERQLRKSYSACGRRVLPSER